MGSIQEETTYADELNKTIQQKEYLEQENDILETSLAITKRDNANLTGKATLLQTEAEGIAKGHLDLQQRFASLLLFVLKEGYTDDEIQIATHSNVSFMSAMQLLLEMAAVAKEEKSMSKALDHDKDHDVSAYIGDEDSIGGSDHEMDFFSSPECSPVKPPSRRASPVWDENHSQKRKRSNGKKMTRRFITSTPDGNKPRRAESGGETPLCELSTNTPARVRRTPKSGLSTPSFGLDEVSDSPISAYAPTPRIYDLANEKSPENFRSEAKVLDFGQSPSIVSLDDIDNLESRLYDSLSGTQIDKSSSTLAQPSSPERYDREQRSDIREENAVAVQGPIVPDMTVENEAMPDEPSTSEVPAVAANLQSGALDTSIDSSENVESVALPLSSLAVDMPDHEPEEVIESSIATPSPRSRTLTSLVSATIYIDDKNYLGIKPPMRRSKSSSCGRLVLSHLLVCLLTCLTLDVFVPLIYCEEGSDCYIFAT